MKNQSNYVQLFAGLKRNHVKNKVVFKQEQATEGSMNHELNIFKIYKIEINADVLF
jgi:hypothetical protein